MNKDELKRLSKLENRIMEIADEFGLNCMPIEFDIVPPQKMLEIMAYRSPVNISSWKYGRDYERLRTIYENADGGLPYEVVINSNPSRAYFMKSNTFVVQVMVMAHVVGHVNFFTENKYFQNTRQDIIEYMAEANRRFNKYERKYGIDEVEAIVDAGHSIQFHTDPFETETEEEKRLRIFDQQKKQFHAPKKSQFADLTTDNFSQVKESIELFNQKLWRKLRAQTPVEPTEDLLRYIIDNSISLEDWQKDILEVLRTEGQYFWPMSRSKFMNEGWATYWHEKIMERLFKENLLDGSEHAQYNYVNSLVKAENPFSLNPYMVGCYMWKTIEKRWNKGQYGPEWENCTDLRKKDEWNTGEMGGREKMFNVMRTYLDWFFMQDFLTPEEVNDMKIYIYEEKETPTSIDYVRSKIDAKKTSELIIQSFSNSGLPKIEVINGDYKHKGELQLSHRWMGQDLDKIFTKETLKHIYRIWGRPCYLESKNEKKTITYVANPDGFSADIRDTQQRSKYDITSMK